MDNLADPIFRELAEHFSRNGSPLTLGLGATSPVAYVQARARCLFLEVLEIHAPHVANILVTSAALDLIRQQRKLLNDIRRDEHAFMAELNSATTAVETLALLEHHLNSPVQEQLSDIHDRLDSHISSWQERFHLTEPWLADAAQVTLNVVANHEAAGYTNRVPLLPSYSDFIPNPNEGRDVQAEGSITLERLLKAEIFQGEDPPIGIFNPRTQTVDMGVKSLLPELEFRLRILLSAMVLDDMQSSDAVTDTPKPLRKRKKFDWLIQYQVLGKSRNEIASTSGHKSNHIGEEISAAARFVGLTLREEKGGRPSKKNARTIRVG